TTSSRSLSFCGITAVIGSTPVQSTSPSCSTQPRMAFNSGTIRSSSSSPIRMRASEAIFATVSRVTDMRAALAGRCLAFKRVERWPDRLSVDEDVARRHFANLDHGSVPNRQGCCRHFGLFHAGAFAAERDDLVAAALHDRHAPPSPLLAEIERHARILTLPGIGA